MSNMTLFISFTLSSSSLKIPLRLSGPFRGVVVLTGLDPVEESYSQVVQTISIRYYASDTCITLSAFIF
jgi:hypothetical protein